MAGEAEHKSTGAAQALQAEAAATTVYRDKLHAIELLRAPGGRGQLVITFTYFGFRDLNAEGFGQKFLLRNGFDVMCFKCATDSWFQGLPMEALTKARAAARGYAFVAAYGSSLGGFAALAFAQHLRPDLILAVSPQFAIDQPFDRRWARQARDITWRYRINRNSVTPASCYLAYDPNDALDAAQVERIANLWPDDRLHHLPLPFSGHPATFYLQETSNLAQFVIDVLASKTPDAVPPKWSVAKRSKTYLSRMAVYAQLKGKERLARQCCARALALGNTSAAVHHAIAAVLIEQGDFDAAYAHCEKAVQLVPDFVQPMVFMASLLQRQGLIEEALNWARRACVQDPENGEAKKMVARLEARAGT